MMLQMIHLGGACVHSSLKTGEEIRLMHMRTLSNTYSMHSVNMLYCTSVLFHHCHLSHLLSWKTSQQHDFKTYRLTCQRDDESLPICCNGKIEISAISFLDLQHLLVLQSVGLTEGSRRSECSLKKKKHVQLFYCSFPLVIFLTVFHLLGTRRTWRRTWTTPWCRWSARSFKWTSWRPWRGWRGWGRRNATYRTSGADSRWGDKDVLQHRLGFFTRYESTLSCSGSQDGLYHADLGIWVHCIIGGSAVWTATTLVRAIVLLIGAAVWKCF